MKLFVGLGNPGAKYAMNRHNIGFLAVDEIAGHHTFTPWRSKFNAEICEGQLGHQKAILLKPQTYMNLSGQSVGEASRFYKIETKDITVFHDELDLAPGKCRVKQGGGHAGHNGLRSVHQHLSADYQRVRLGIGHPGRKELVSTYVLQNFPKADLDWLNDLLCGIGEGAVDLAEGHADKFMNVIAKRLAFVASPQDLKAAPSKSDPSDRKPEMSKSSEPPDTRNPLQKLIDKFR